MKGRFLGPDDPRIVVPDQIESDLGPGLAFSAFLLPSPYKCERVVFAATDMDYRDAPASGELGLEIPLDDLRERPGFWIDKLNGITPRSGFRPPLEMLIDALDQASGAD